MPKASRLVGFYTEKTTPDCRADLAEGQLLATAGGCRVTAEWPQSLDAVENPAFRAAAVRPQGVFSG